MTHSSDSTITINTISDVDTDFTIELNNFDDMITLDLDDTHKIDPSNLSWDFGNKIDPDEVEKMCKHYPALDKVWKNFKSVYDMVKQDYNGNYKIDDEEIPF